MTVPDADAVAAVGRGLDRVRNELADAGADPAAVTVVAMTKGFGPWAPLAASACGIDDCGENYAQALLRQIDEVGEAAASIRWHFTGRLQSNKVRLVADHVALWQTIDRMALVAEVATRAPGAAVLIQVDPFGDPGKGGAPLDVADDLVESARDRGLDVYGVMAVGRAGDDVASRRGFEATAALADRHGLAVRSFGMSGDLAVAAAAGTTMVRVGTTLFGPRPTAPTDAASAARR